MLPKSYRSYGQWCSSSGLPSCRPSQANSPPASSQPRLARFPLRSCNMSNLHLPSENFIECIGTHLYYKYFHKQNRIRVRIIIGWGAGSLWWTEFLTPTSKLDLEVPCFLSAMTGGGSATVMGSWGPSNFWIKLSTKNIAEEVWEGGHTVIILGVF